VVRVAETADGREPEWRPGGVGAVVPTPLAGDEVDEQALRRLVTYMLDGGVQMLLTLGSGGEQPNLATPQRRRAMNVVVDECAGRASVLAGIGDCATDSVLANLADAAEAGVDGVLIAEPYFYKLRQAELIGHYVHVADRSDLPIVLYHHPARWTADATSGRSTTDALRLLGAHPRIVGVKDSVTDFRDHQRLVFEARNHDFRVLVSAGRLLFASLLIGSDGGIFHEAAVAPGLYVALARLVAQGEIAKARDMQQLLAPLGDVMGRYDPASAKEALWTLDLCRPDLRRPLQRIPQSGCDEIRAELQRLELLPAAQGR
jgi:4-hydroxy-tetrahydrodipicolinate synthase